MNAEAQKLMDTINRLMAKGMSRDDDTIKTLEGLIEEELAKGETDDAFLNQPNRPEVGRPNVLPDPKYATPQEFTHNNPSWQKIERSADMRQRDEVEQRRMFQDYLLSVEGRDSAFGTAPMTAPYPTMQPTPQYGFKNVERMHDYEFDPTQQISRQRQTFARPGTQAAIHERNMRTLPPPLPRTAQDGFTLGNMERPSFQRPSAGPSTETELNAIQEQMTPEEFEQQNPNWRELERAEDQRDIDAAEEARMMRDFIARPEEHGKYALGRQWVDESPGVFKEPYRYTTPMPPAHYGFDNIQGILEADQPLGRQPGRGSFQRPQAGPSAEEELEMIMPEELEEEYR